MQVYELAELLNIDSNAMVVWFSQNGYSQYNNKNHSIPDNEIADILKKYKSQNVSVGENTARQEDSGSDPETWIALTWRVIKSIRTPHLIISLLVLAIIVYGGYTISDINGYDLINSIIQRKLVKIENTDNIIPTVHYLFVYVSVEGTEDECSKNGCIFRYYASGLFQVPEGQIAEYKDRAKALGGVIRIDARPGYRILNPEQYSDNKTYLEYVIEPLNKSSILKGEVELIIRNSMTKENGKIGLHLPYFTKHVTLLIDFSHLDFYPTSQPKVQIEAITPNGTLQSGAVEPRTLSWNGGHLIMLISENIPEKSSLILRWKKDDPL